MNALANLRLRHLGYVLQTGGLLPFLSAGENILLHWQKPRHCQTNGGRP